MFRFAIRDVLWLMVVVDVEGAKAVAHFLEGRPRSHTAPYDSSLAPEPDYGPAASATCSRLSERKRAYSGRAKQTGLLITRSNDYQFTTN
jgi:hypothetical protein